MAADDDPRALLTRALEQNFEIISRIRPDQSSLPTPCADWDVRALVNHTVYDLRAFTASVSDGERPSIDDDLIGANWTIAYRMASDSLLEAWRRRGIVGTLQLGAGGRPAAWVAAMHFTGQTIHGWDIASAIGHSTDLDPEIGQAALDWARETLEPFRGRAFGREVPVPVDAPVYERLAGLCGRSPS